MSETVSYVLLSLLYKSSNRRRELSLDGVHVCVSVNNTTEIKNVRLKCAAAV